jgi:CheY-like chemotaxis protein
MTEPLRIAHVSANDVPRRGSILVVEDREDVRQGMAQLLEMHGFLVADARDGEAALARLDAHGDVALILLDLLLPGSVSGADFRARQLADPDYALIPTIIVTASDTKEEQRHGLRADAWIEKPFRFDELLDMVRRHVVPEVPSAVA